MKLVKEPTRAPTVTVQSELDKRSERLYSFFIVQGLAPCAIGQPSGFEGSILRATALFPSMRDILRHNISYVNQFLNFFKTNADRINTSRKRTQDAPQSTFTERTTEKSGESMGAHVQEFAASRLRMWHGLGNTPRKGNYEAHS